MSKVLIGCALRKEVTTLRQRLDAQVDYLMTGIGTRRTQATLEQHFRAQPPSLFIFTGTAGQLDPSLDMGQIFFPEAWSFQNGNCFYTDPGLTSLLRRQGWTIQGQGLTVKAPVMRAKTRLELYENTGAGACDMEAAVALKIASDFGIPCLAPKVVSDTADTGLVGYWTHLDTNLRKLTHYLQELLSVVG